MIIAIRIRGLVNIRKDYKQAMNVLRLRRKYCAILISKKTEHVLDKIKDYIMYGEIDKEVLKELITKRGRMPGEKPVKVDDKFIEELIAEKTTLKSKNIKPFFRLHPPIGGFKKPTKRQFPKGVLGKNPKINEILRKMLQ